MDTVHVARSHAGRSRVGSMVQPALTVIACCRCDEGRCRRERPARGLAGGHVRVLSRARRLDDRTEAIAVSTTLASNAIGACAARAGVKTVRRWRHLRRSVRMIDAATECVARRIAECTGRERCARAHAILHARVLGICTGAVCLDCTAVGVAVDNDDRCVDLRGRIGNLVAVVAATKANKSKCDK